MLCAVVSKTCASFSGSDSFKSSVRLPFFWCNWCPFDTESRASLLQHVVSQHCFLCRFCPYLALSRFDVITHGLKHHAQFSQFREQRLRACHLKRDLFQLHFDPRSENQPDRKRRLRNDSQEEEEDDAGPSSPKHSRKEIRESISNTEDEERLQDQESSSESVDDLPLQFPQETLPETKSSRLLSMSEKGCSVATHVMENVVSSSGMELDLGTDQNLTPKSRHLELCLSPAPSTSVLSEDSRRCEQLPVSAVKQEKKCDDADFARALGKTVDSSGVAGGVWKAQPAARSSDAASVRVKEEPEEGPPPSPPLTDPLYLQGELQGHVLSRAVSSPPLSNIRVENLQRQFEESFGVHPVASTSSAAVSELQQSEPHPVHLIAQPGRQTAQGLVENFLISPSKSAPSVCEHDSKSGLEWGQDRSSPSMLRHLLTRPLNKRAHQSSATSAEVGRREREDSHPGEPDRRGKDRSRTSATQVLDNFLLTADKQQVSQKSKSRQRHDSGEFKELELSSTENAMISHPDAGSGENVSAFIKQEPEDSTEDYSAALHLMASVMPAAKLTSFHRDVSVSEQQQDVPSAHHSREPDLQDMLQSSASKQEEKGWTSRPPSEEGGGQNPPLQTITAAEALKSYSNMSLRDLLTMDTRSSLSSVHGQGVESGDAGRKWDCGGSAVESSVVWECGFCHFEDQDKAVVLAHRQQHHTRLMQEAGMQGTPLRVHEVDEEEEKLSLGEADEEGEDHVSWMDQPSTSAGYTSIPQIFSSFPSSRVAGPGGLMYRRAHRSRGFRRDDDFDYLSESTVESESDTEPDNLEDKTYEPPRNLDFSDTNVSSDEEDSLKKMKSKSPWGDKLRKRKHHGQKKNLKKGPSLRYGTHSKKSSDMAGLMLEDDAPENGKELTELYRCISCRRQPLPLAGIKDHIRYTPDSRHLLMVRPMDDPDCLQFVCPGARCDHTTLFTEGQSYLVHVLQCQGHIFDVLKSAVHATASLSLSKRKEQGGVMDCPVLHCRVLSYTPGQLWAHLDEHLSHLHTSQMLLFRSVCTVMAKLYGRVEGFDRYVCYRCSSILIDLPRVLQHMMTDHGGQVRGVLIVTHRTECRSQGIVVAIQCLQCSMRVPSLHLWFTHTCQSTSHILVEETTSSQPSADAAHSSGKAKAYNPDPSIPPFEEWIWGQQSSKVKSSTSGSGQAETASQDPLPIIRSILLSHPPHRKREARTELKAAPQVTDRKAAVEESKEEEEEEITAMVQCKVCQQFLAEKSFSQHGCDRCGEAAAAAAVKREKKDGEGQALSASKDSEGQAPSSASNSSSSSSKQHQSYLPGDGTISHSKLLAALATRHHNNPSGPQASQSFSPVSVSRPQPASSSHPSLISLLTQSDMASLKQTPSQPHQAATTSTAPMAAKTTHLRDQLAKFQMLQSAHLASVQVKPHNTEESQDKTIRSILSQVLRQKPNDSQQSQFSSGKQDNGDGLKASGSQAAESSLGSAGVSSLPGKEGPEQQQQQQQPNPAPAETPEADPCVQTGKGEGESQPASTSSGHPSLMKFLHQQGDQVRQVLGNILDDQEESSQS